MIFEINYMNLYDYYLYYYYMKLKINVNHKPNLNW